MVEPVYVRLNKGIVHRTFENFEKKLKYEFFNFAKSKGENQNSLSCL
jgi:hypothetical protein